MNFIQDNQSFKVYDIAYKAMQCFNWGDRRTIDSEDARKQLNKAKKFIAKLEKGLVGIKNGTIDVKV